MTLEEKIEQKCYDITVQLQSREGFAKIIQKLGMTKANVKDYIYVDMNTSEIKWIEKNYQETTIPDSYYGVYVSHHIPFVKKTTDVDITSWIKRWLK